MKSRLTLLMVVLLAASFNAQESNAQCRSFSKRKCAPTLAPYKNTGRMVNAFMVPGDYADIHLTFNGGSTYRIAVCASPVLGPVDYQILDMDKNLIYDSTKDPNRKDYWDFKLVATQQLIVHVQVPESEEQTIDIIHQGCVTIMSGFKDN